MWVPLPVGVIDAAECLAQIRDQIARVRARLGLDDRRLWWWFEGFDDRSAGKASGLHLNLWLDRP